MMSWLKKIFFFFLIIFIFNALIKNIVSFQEKYQFYLLIKNQYENLKKKNIELKTQLLRKKDPQEIEKKAREKLNLAKENEIVIILPSPTHPLITFTPTPQPNWQKWWDVYFSSR